jgi:hypothetical protein
MSKPSPLHVHERTSMQRAATSPTGRRRKSVGRIRSPRRSARVEMPVRLSALAALRLRTNATSQAAGPDSHPAVPLLSLHEAFGADFPGRQARGPHTPDLSLIDPGIFFGRGGEADVCEDVEHRLAGSRRRLAVTRQRDPVAVLSLDDDVQVQLDATIGAYPQIVDAVRVSREAALVPPIDRKVKSSPCNGIASWPARMASMLAP